MKDNFSTRSADYKRYRPTYPAEVFEFIKKQLKGFENAWDCGTGNGQVANKLSSLFKTVEATDISENQIENAPQKKNINYSIQPAEQTNFENEKFDLIITAQAIHWFEFDKFYSEVKRCLKPDGIFVVLGYGLFTSTPETNKIIKYFYEQVIGPYWDSERKYLDEAYQSIPFPFEEIPCPHFEQKYNWSIQHLLGYLRTWSAVKHYERIQNKDAVSIIEKELKEVFGAQNKVIFPILFRMGKISKSDQ